ncbi:unnamed protein product [Clonostachys rosea]|uniref:Zn(2)-C6 fungal-type domain-containing protein n=1 Tax=Bionectria ochroleuca TaxID=29856 RepID=A0ABY6UYE8_BIOOC|nr:unnamed protein product [Clonostachys rosea]
MANHFQFSETTGVGDIADGDAGHQRKLIKTTDDFTLRKRVPTACQFCRLRKTKCDNLRPSCSYCVRHKALCIYGNDRKTGNVPEVDSFVSPRPDSSEIIRRLEELKRIIERGSYGAPPAPPALSDSTELDTEVVPNTAFNGQIPGHSDLSLPSSPKIGKSPFSAIRCESVLQWPIFGTVIPKVDEVARSLALLPNVEDDGQGKTVPMNDSQTMSPMEMTQGRSFKSICTDFLIHFHPRNPILDESDLLQHAELADDKGLGWNSSSCLLHLVSALLFSTQIWEKPAEVDNSLDGISPPGPSSNNKALAVFHFAEARKRIGFLGHKLIDIQCLFLAFVYEKTYFRLLQAWFYLQQAADRLKVRLARNNVMPWMSDQNSRTRDLHLEQRVFWSCFRAERELLLYVDLPRSGLEDLSYPHQLPQPPVSLPALPNETGARASWMGASERQLAEQGWGYYLAEISLRRTIDGTISLLYEKSEEYWVENPAQIMSYYHELDEQRDMWQVTPLVM